MDIQITEASINDIDEIIKLKQDIWNRMENKDWYVIDGTNKEFLEDQLKNNGFILKAVNNNKIIGFLIVKYNIKRESELIKNTNLQNELNYCIELCNGAVAPEYRGNHLYAKMVEKAEKNMTDKYNIKYILATVHPDNIASKKTLLNMGYEIYCKTKMYGNKDRCILIKQFY